MLYNILLAASLGIFLYKLLQLLNDLPRLWSEDGMGVQGPGSRRLGHMEKLLAKFGEMGIIILSNALIIRSKIPLTEMAVRKALLCLSQRHPLLRMRIGKEDGHLTYMKEMEEFQLDLKVCKNADWQEVMEDNLHRVYKVETGPLWGVQFIPESNYNDGQQTDYPHQAACIFAFHHVITDGPSYAKLFNEFLINLQQILDGNELPVTESMNLLAPLDAYVDNVQKHSIMNNMKVNIFKMLVETTPFIMKFLMKNFIKAPIFTKNHGVEVDRNPDAPQRTAIIPTELSKEQTSQLLVACKKHKVTVQCAIQTAATLAYLKMAESGSVKETHKIKAGPTCNLRPYLNTDELTDYLGAYFSGIVVDTEVSCNLEFWDIASKVNADLRAQLKKGNPVQLLQFLSIIGGNDALIDFMLKIIRKLPGARDRDLVFTNLGSLRYLDRDSESNVKLTARFGASAEHKQGAVFANNLATFNGVLFWTFIYYSHVTSKTQAQMYADYTIEALLEAIKE